LSETEKSVSLAEVLSAADADSPMLLAVGPEGGWTEDEIEIFAGSGWASASLGSTILRAETAAVAALAIARTLR
jgi:16S rRNA (uracil1498-N3)-methyltransferase